jgi:hypothetical protein
VKPIFQYTSGRHRDLFFVVGLCFLCVAFGVVVGTWIASSIAYAGDRVSTVGNVGKTPKLPDVSGRGERTWIEGTKGWKQSGNYLYPAEAFDSVGIGVTPTAKLDIDGLVRIRGGTPGSNKVLTSDANGLASWVTPSNSDPNAWKITGNAGTTSGTNFIGTTDNQALDIRTNNTLRTRITTKGQIETYNTGYSVFVGQEAGADDDLSSNKNVFVGNQAGYSNTTGYLNVFIGYRAGYSNTTGRCNIANGCYALDRNTTGRYNIANGYYALYWNTTGSYNVANGYYALRDNSSGNSNVANGHNALRENTTGFGNTALGDAALVWNTTGYNNTAIGDDALIWNTTGTYNTAIGYMASVHSNNLTNATAIGNHANVDASNKVMIGNDNVTWIGGHSTWHNTSDGRFKKDVKEDVPGLAFITKLRPITFHFDMDKLKIYLNTPDSLRDKKGEARKERITYAGFIAQEVEEAANEVGFNFSGVDKPRHDKGLYSLGYAEFVVPLVKAVQEQQEMIEQLQKQIEELKKSK